MTRQCAGIATSRGNERCRNRVKSPPRSTCRLVYCPKHRPPLAAQPPAPASGFVRRGRPRDASGICGRAGDASGIHGRARDVGGRTRDAELGELKRRLAALESTAAHALRGEQIHYTQQAAQAAAATVKRRLAGVAPAASARPQRSAQAAASTSLPAAPSARTVYSTARTVYSTATDSNPHPAYSRYAAPGGRSVRRGGFENTHPAARSTRPLWALP